MLPLLPLHNIRGPAAIPIRELVCSSVNKEDGGKPVHASGASAWRPRFLPHTVLCQVHFSEAQPWEISKREQIGAKYWIMWGPGSHTKFQIQKLVNNHYRNKTLPTNHRSEIGVTRHHILGGVGSSIPARYSGSTRFWSSMWDRLIGYKTSLVYVTSSENHRSELPFLPHSMFITIT